MDSFSSPHFTCCLVDQVLELSLTLTTIQDEAISQALQSEFQKVLQSHDAKHVILDMQKIKYISSVAFRPLLWLRKRVQESKGRLIICCLTKVIGDIFYSTKMIDPVGDSAALFELAEDLPKAHALLAADSQKSTKEE